MTKNDKDYFPALDCQREIVKSLYEIGWGLELILAKDDESPFFQ